MSDEPTRFVKLTRHTEHQDGQSEWVNPALVERVSAIKLSAGSADLNGIAGTELHLVSGRTVLLRGKPDDNVQLLIQQRPSSEEAR